MSRNWKIPLEGDPELTTLLTHAPLARTNLLVQSQDLSTTWLNITSNDTSNAAIAPDGTTTADKLYDDSTASTVHYIAQQVTVTAATQYTFSVYCKAAEYDDVALYASAPNQGKYFNLATGAVGGNLVAAPDDAGIEDVGDGWYRCWITVTTSDTSESFRIYLTASGTSETYSGDGASGIYVWGAQLETGATPTPYIPTTTVARTINSRTNICKQSENLSSSWVNTASVDTQGETIAPDGSLTGNKLVDDGSTGTKDVRVAQSVTVATATAYTFSLFAKADQLDIVALQLFGFTTPGTSEVWFDLGAGTVGTVDAGFDDSGIEDYGSGWYRCWGSFTTDAADTTGTLHIVVCETDGLTTATADGTSSIFVWGVQLEEGSAPTAYIPTTTAPVTVTGYIPRGSLVDDMHQALETVLEDTGNINDLWKRYKQLN